MSDLKSAQQQIDGQRRLEALIAERERMTRVLADVENGRLAKGEIPADAYTYYGRINEADQQIERLSGNDARKTALADRLTGYASVFQQPCAEACIATSFAAQVRAGNKLIDLSQRYETTDPVKAAVRHARALRNIEVLVHEAAQLGLSVNPGHAVAVTINTNRLALQHEPENRLPTPEPARFRV